MTKQALLHGRKIDHNSDAFIEFGVSAYLAETAPSQENKKARKKSYLALLRANKKLIKKEKN